VHSVHSVHSVHRVHRVHKVHEVLGAACLKKLLQQFSTLIRQNTFDDAQAVIEAREFMRVRH
jgi:hypothetical protein